MSFTLPFTWQRQFAAIAGFGFFGLIYLSQVRGWDQRYLIISVIIIATLFLLSYFFANLKRARLIEDTPTSKIRSAAQGYVEISGVAELAKDQTLLAAALTQTPCLWFRFIIEEYRRSGKNASWQIVESGQSDSLFALNDHSATCLIDPRGAETTLIHRQSWRGNSRHPLTTDNAAGFFTLGGFGKQYRYTEWRIHNGDLIYALGHLHTQRGASLDEQIKQQQNKLLNELKQDQAALLKRYDSNRDGEINQVEWERARRHAQFQAEKTVQANLQNEQASILGYSNEHPEQPFILSAIDPEILAKRYRWSAFWSALGFVGGCLGTAFMLSRLFGIALL